MKTFLFDIGNVLTDFDFNDMLVAYANGGEVLPLSQEDLDFYDRVERGVMGDQDYVDYLNQTRGLGWTRDDLIALWQRMFSVNEKGRALFDAAASAGVRIYTLSNISAFHIDAITSKWDGFFDGAEGLFLSYQIGARKPEPEIYRHVLGQLGVAGEDCFFVDDLPENVEAARSHGINAHLFVPENHVAIEEAAGAFFGL